LEELEGLGLTTVTSKVEGLELSSYRLVKEISFFLSLSAFDNEQMSRSLK
jgi:hypothetical protein